MNFFNRNERIINNTLNNNESPYKIIISENGLKKLKNINFDKNKFKNQTFCPITQKKFCENDKIIKLPCNHIFEPNSIIHWLKNESNTCPVCRYEMESIEIKIDISSNITDNSSNIENIPSNNLYNMNFSSTNILIPILNNLFDLSNNISNFNIILNNDISNNNLLNNDISSNNLLNNNHLNTSLNIENEIINNLNNIYLRYQEEKEFETALLNSITDT